MLWWQCKLVQPLWKIVWKFLKKLKTELPYDPIIPLLGIYPKEVSNYPRECTPMGTAFPYSLQHFSNSQNTETFKVFVHRCMSKENMIHICVSICVCTHTHTCTHTMEYYSTLKKKEILPFVTMTVWMNMENSMISATSQTKTSTA